MEHDAPVVAIDGHVADVLAPDDIAPDVVVWEADGTIDGVTGYGAPLAARLAAAGLTVAVVPLEERTPSAVELTSPAHVISGGSTAVNADVAWLAATREALQPVLARARRGTASVTGICFGAQLIAHLLAGPDAVRAHPDGLQAGLVEVRDVGVVPTGGADVAGIVASFHHHRVERAPIEAAGGEILLDSDRTPVQAFDLGAGVRGVQFHPELEPRQLRLVLRAHPALVSGHGISVGAVSRELASRGAGWDTALWESLVLDPIIRLRPTDVAA